MSDRRLLPFAPLESVLRTRYSGAAYRKASFDDTPVAAMSEQLSVDRRVIYRWRANGIPLFVADEISVLVGLHPSEIWGEQWWDARDLSDPRDRKKSSSGMS